MSLETIPQQQQQRGIQLPQQKQRQRGIQIPYHQQQKQQQRIVVNCCPSLKWNSIAGKFILFSMCCIMIQNFIEVATIRKRIQKYPFFRFPLYIIILRLCFIVSSIVGATCMIVFVIKSTQPPYRFFSTASDIQQTMIIINSLVLTVNVVTLVLFLYQISVYASENRIHWKLV